MKYLKQWMVDRGLTAEQTARLLDITPSHISLLLAGKRTPSVKLAMAISKLIKKSLDEILRAS